MSKEGYIFIDNDKNYSMIGPYKGYVEYSFKICSDPDETFFDKFVKNIREAIKNVPIGFGDIIINCDEDYSCWTLTLCASGDLCGNESYVVDLIRNNCPHLKSIRRIRAKFVYEKE